MVTKLELRPIAIEPFGVPDAIPEIPPSLLARLCDDAYGRAGCEWLVIYGDREHSGNLLFLTGFDPRFEEALLVLGPKGRRSFVVGNECYDYAAASPIGISDLQLSQSMSLMGQDRSGRPRLADALRGCGIAAGDRVGVVGWKYLEPEEGDETPAFFVPSFVVSVLQSIVGSSGALVDRTAVLLDPSEGLRSVVGAEHIALYEWGMARASAALWRAVSSVREGDTELEAAARIGYAGEPLSCHTMMTTAGPDGAVIGLRSPTARPLRRGAGISAAVGYWGGLSSRAGLLADRDDDFLRLAVAYFRGLLAWYDTVDVGVSGGEIFGAVADALGRGGLSSALNPGHLTSFDEWTNTPIRPGSAGVIRSGMPFQVDIIPQPVRRGWALNCEDGVAIADADLRAALATRYPAVHARIEARRRFVGQQLGITLKDCILPLSSTPLCLPPFWFASDRLLAAV